MIVITLTENGLLLRKGGAVAIVPSSAPETLPAALRTLATPAPTAAELGRRIAAARRRYLSEAA